MEGRSTGCIDKNELGVGKETQQQGEMAQNIAELEQE